MPALPQAELPHTELPHTELPHAELPHTELPQDGGAAAVSLHEAIFLASGLSVDDPETVDPGELFLYGIGASRKGYLESSAVLFEAASEAAPEEDQWGYQRALADALVGLRRNAEAARIYRHLIATERHPPTAVVYGNLAVACYRMGDTPGARAAISRAAAIDPGNAEVTKTLGLVMIRMGDRAGGAEHLRTAIKKNPRLPEAQAALAELEASGGKTERAVERYQQLLSLLKEERPRDYHRRWRDLFYPSPRSTEAEIQQRIEQLETVLESQGTGSIRSSPPEGERDPP